MAVRSDEIRIVRTGRVRNDLCPISFDHEHNIPFVPFEVAAK